MSVSETRYLFIGGPGRSGTSFVARQLGAHPEVTSFPDIELKLLTEKGGLLDLYHSLVEHYSPNRAGVAERQFRSLSQALLKGQFGQSALSTQVDAVKWETMTERFLGSFAPFGCPEPQSSGAFFLAARELLEMIAELAITPGDDTRSETVFLEKTPHCLLSADFLNKIAPDASFVHVMRDPRAVAYSLLRMRWGPDSLMACCAWVRSYCQALALQSNSTNGSKPSLLFTHIEEIVAHPGPIGIEITKWIGLAEWSGMFTGSSAKALNGWQRDCAPEDLSLLNRELQYEAVELGYEAEEIGVLSSTSSALEPAL